jgi:hypothetical protein
LNVNEREHLDIHQWAKQYAQFGLSVIPVFYGEKKPLVSWQAYQRTKPTDSELQEWFGNGMRRNIGIVCGHVSGNMVVLDFDKPEAYRRFFADTGKVESETPVVRTRRGLHVWLRSAEIVRSFVISDLSLDVIGENKFVLAPPSRHPSGITYEFVSSIREPMMVEDFHQAIARRCKALGTQLPAQVRESTPQRKWRPTERTLPPGERDRIVRALVPFWRRGQRNYLCMYLLGVLVKRSVSQDDAQDIVTRICDLTSDEEKRQRLSQVAYHYHKPAHAVSRLKGFTGLRELLTGC